MLLLLPETPLDPLILPLATSGLHLIYMGKAAPGLRELLGLSKEVPGLHTALGIALKR